MTEQCRITDIEGRIEGLHRILKDSQDAHMGMTDKSKALSESEHFRIWDEMFDLSRKLSEEKSQQKMVNTIRGD